MLRMGTFGRFDEPYMTIAPTFEATIVETLADLAENDYLYKGLRSTLWCVTDETALAEAEIEYKDHVSPVGLRALSRDGRAARALLEKFGLADDGTPLSVAIWTTTPWTLPANVAIALSPEATYGVYRIGGEDVIVATSLATPVLERLSGDAAATGANAVASLRGEAAGAALERLAVRHPLFERDSLIVLADYVELETGTGAVHTAPGHGADDFETGARYAFAGDHAGRRVGPLHRRGRTVRRDADLRSERAHRRRPARVGSAGLGGVVRAQLSALLALQEPRDLPRHRAVVHRDGPQRAARACRARGARRGVAPRMGREPHVADGRQPSRMVRVAPARVGHADPVDRLHRVR